MIRDKRQAVTEYIDDASVAIGVALAVAHDSPAPCECAVCWPLRQAQQRLVLARAETKTLPPFRKAWSAEV